MTDCQNKEERTPLIREGTTQEERFPAALAPDYAQIDERGIAEKIVSVKEYSRYLKYYDLNNTESGDWQPFFSKDVSALLAVMAVQNVDDLRINIKKCIDSSEEKIKKSGCLFSCIGMIAKEIDILKECLPAEHSMKSMLQNLIKNHLSIKFSQLICCYKKLFCDNRYFLKDVVPSCNVIISEQNKSFFDILNYHDFSIDWIYENGTKEKSKQWNDYIGVFCDWKQCPENVDSESNVFQENIEELEKILYQFLKVYARVVSEAKQALEASWTRWKGHEPHYALFLAVARLMEHARAEMNTLTKRHLDFYYREILQFKEKEAVSARAHVLIEIAKQVPSHAIKAGELFKAGKDVLGKDVFFASEREFVVNKAKVAALKTIFFYRPEDDELKSLRSGENAANKQISEKDVGRIYASSFTNSDDGQGGELISEDKSWHPFFNKKYENGEIYEIKMPKDEIGFAIASHYLLMADGTRTVTIKFKKNGKLVSLRKLEKNISCFFTGPEGWIEGKDFVEENFSTGTIKITLSIASHPIVPYSDKIHGYNFQANLPILRIILRHNDDKYPYSSIDSIEFDQIDLNVCVNGLKSLSVSNDFGPVDISKPFQPFGASPIKNSSLVIGSSEVFQKKLCNVSVRMLWQNTPRHFPSPCHSQNNRGKVTIEYLFNGKLIICNDKIFLYDETCKSNDSVEEFNITKCFLDDYEFSESSYYDTLSQYGFIRLKLCDDFGQKEYEKCLINYIKKVTEGNDCPNQKPPIAPVGPFVTEISLDYTAKHEINLDNKNEFEKRLSKFFHITPFGCAEQHPYLKAKNIQNQKNHEVDTAIYLLPQFKTFPPSKDTSRHEAEFYIGITDLKPPQNLALLFQVADGTANPQKEKPKFPHIRWSYLRNNEWISFPQNAVEDNTDELLTSGIITFSVPRDASDDNTLLPSGMHWIRAAVDSAPDAVCKLRMVAAQALKVTFTDQGNDPNFSAKVLPPETISKLDQPDAAIKKITQPFSSYGGRGKEEDKAFYTRVSERLRHKDRAVTLWDYERLVLEQFPEVHKVKCLNHTEFKGGKCTLKPGHVTIVTIADQQHHVLPDRLRPNVSLGLLKKIAEFLEKRISKFVSLHVVNPLFEEIKVDFKVKLRSFEDETYSINKLQNGIVKFMSPWAFSGTGSPSFGGKIYKSMLINFVEEQECVDYVINFNMMFSGDNYDKDCNEINGSTDISILVSAPEHQHTITAIHV